MGFRKQLSGNKVGRTINSLLPAQKRYGQCTPDQCETLDGHKGSACCKLGFTCPLLHEGSCGIYPVRPRNCRVFPRTPDDLKLVRNCGYRFKP